jgi:hypothetical protein
MPGSASTWGSCRNTGPIRGISSMPVIYLDPTDLMSGGKMYVISCATRPYGHGNA